MSRYLPMGPSPAREPNFRRTPPGLPDFGSGASLVQEQRERRGDSIARPVSPEQITDCRPGHARLAYALKRLLDLVSDWITEHASENVNGRGLAVFPDGQRSAEMRDVYARLAIEEGIDHRQPNTLRLCAGRNCAQ